MEIPKATTHNDGFKFESLRKQYKTFYYESYGCTANRSDTEIILAILNNSGYHGIDDPSQASMIFINTCAVKKTTQDRMIERLRKLECYGRPVIVAGCLPRIDLSSICEVIPNYFVLIDPASVHKIMDVIKEGLRKHLRMIQFSDMHKDKSLLPRKKINNYIGIVPISEGCLGNCAYCCTRLARGRLFSYSSDNILKNIRKAVSEGAVEIQITAQDTASFSSRGHNLVDLLREIINIKSNFRIRVGMMNPDQAKRITDDLLDVYENQKIYKFLHLPVQSGSDKMLETMNRNYTISDFNEIINKFRSHFPTISIATDVIVGFPGESEEDFINTRELLEIIEPDVINISKYANRPGTSGSNMKQLDANVIALRSRRLAKTASEIILKRNERMIGAIEEICPIEEKGKSIFGRTHNYKKTFVKGKEHLGMNLIVKITSVHLRYLDCEILRSEQVGGSYCTHLNLAD